jgi:cytochrome c biogenesis protein CcmG/thiol:disulfide interchange protein DsbE
MKSLLSLVVVLTLAAFTAQAAWQSEVAQDGEGLKQMPEIKLADFDGKPFEAASLKGSILVLDFWATWCTPCIAEVPVLNRLQEKYSARGVKVIGVTMASGEAGEVKPFVTRHKMKYMVLMGDDNQAYDFNLMGFPTTLIVTRDGKIYKRYIGTGPLKAQQMESDIQKLLAAE